jgi:hypothetical protein
MGVGGAGDAEGLDLGRRQILWKHWPVWASPNVRRRHTLPLDATCLAPTSGRHQRSGRAKAAPRVTGRSWRRGRNAVRAAAPAPPGLSTHLAARVVGRLSPPARVLAALEAGREASDLAQGCGLPSDALDPLLRGEHTGIISAAVATSN